MATKNTISKKTKQSSNTKKQTIKKDNDKVLLDKHLEALELLYNSKFLSEYEYEIKKQEINNHFLSSSNQTTNESIQPVVVNTGKVVMDVINLTKQYKGKNFATINKLNFQLKEGEFHVFIGANGAGKTTTIKALVGAYANWSGKILINGYDIHTAIAKDYIGYIPEKTLFPKNMSAKQYLISMAMLSGIPKSKAVKFANDKLSELNMKNLANKNPNSFSSGQQKKILLAQALVHNPKILIMDEPTANLDPAARHEFYTIMTELIKDGKSVFMSTHILSEVGKYANHITILDGGQIMYSGDVLPGTDLEKVYFTHVKKGSMDTGLVASEYESYVDFSLPNNNQTND